MVASRGYFNRREFIGALGAGIGVAGCGAAVLEPVDPLDTSTDVNTQEEETITTEVAAENVSEALRRKLLDRITFGPTADELQEINAQGYTAFLQAQLDPEAISDSAADALLAPLQTLEMSVAELLDQPSQLVWDEFRAGPVIRGAFSNRQLYERMVEFWNDHFNVSLEATDVMKVVFDREVIRQHALGNFRDLLHATARSAAMLFFLDNRLNVASHPNENYARELLELHTVGIDGGYTQIDVEELARAFTGWSVEVNNLIPTYLDFIFRPEEHDYGAKQIMGLSIPANGGITDGEQALDYLANHPKTASFLATKLVRFFIADDPPAALVAQVAAAYTQSGGDIRATLEALLSAESLALAQPKLKRPFHLFVGALRQSQGQVTDIATLPWALQRMGHLQFHWPDPDGYPQEPEYWASALLSRWNFAMYYALGVEWGVFVDPAELAAAAGATTSQQLMQLWNDLFFLGLMPAAEVDAIEAYCENLTVPPWEPNRREDESFALALSSPSYQWY